MAADQDISGAWRYTGSALMVDGVPLYHWAATVLIERVESGGYRVTLAADRSQSRSVSRPVRLKPLGDGRQVLLYDYIADPEHEGTATHDFFGVSRFVFDPSYDRAEGHYFNFNGRYTFGTMVLHRA